MLLLYKHCFVYSCESGMIDIAAYIL